MLESSPSGEQSPGPSGSQANRPSPLGRAWVAALALAVAAVVGLLSYRAWPPGEPTSRPDTAERPDSAPVAVEEPPAISPAELLGLSAELPATVEALNQEAFTTCARLVQDLPNRPEAHAVAAFIHNRHGRTAEAAECWQRALEVNAKFAPAYNGLGIVAADKGDNEKATELLRKAIELDPMLGHSHSLLTDVLLRQGKAKEALAAANEYVKRFPKAGDSHFWLGQVYLDLREYDKARQSHEEAIRCDPDYTAAYHSLATVWGRLGDRAKARQYREKFAELKEKDLEEDRGRSRSYRDLPTQQVLAASYHLAAGRVHFRFGDPKKGEAHWRRGAAVAPKLTACRESLVAYYEGQNRLVSALGQLEELLALEPKNAAYWTRLGRVQARLGDLDAADAALRKVIEVAPAAPGGYLDLVEFYLQSRRRIPDAVALAEKAAEMSPSVLAYMMLSAAREENGDRPGAIAAVEKAVELEPQNQEIRGFRERLKAKK